MGGRKEGKVPVGDSRCSSHRTRCVTVVCALPVTVDKGSASERQKYTSGSPTHLISRSDGSNRLQAEAFRRWIVVHDAIRIIALLVAVVNPSNSKQAVSFEALFSSNKIHTDQ